MNTPENPPAFPSHCSMGGRANEGMTLRDYFAIRILQAKIRNKGVHFHASPEEEQECLDRATRTSYQVADALIAARQPQPRPAMSEPT